ncbi:hypothetical protein HELRODRAFT_192244 [Helobdella robusta]|uniref:Transmembrane protein n=1 Tax=Helobdella robusta TaxID=6412 RepID=T1FTR4_HELRO|nr:hypothetical protein HELRODRAFT_192244 [Helobdella robusta]ESO01720.1 hypothetical protein HELRODRAFT_192244 [Helobdella robusta]
MAPRRKPQKNRTQGFPKNLQLKNPTDTTMPSNLPMFSSNPTELYQISQTLESSTDASDMSERNQKNDATTTSEDDISFGESFMDAYIFVMLFLMCIGMLVQLTSAVYAIVMGVHHAVLFSALRFKGTIMCLAVFMLNIQLACIVKTAFYLANKPYGTRLKPSSSCDELESIFLDVIEFLIDMYETHYRGGFKVEIDWYDFMSTRNRLATLHWVSETAKPVIL